MTTSTETAKKNKHALAVYKLPGGVTISLRRATNAIRRKLVEMPDTNMRAILDTVAAGLIAKIEFPADYLAEGAPASIKEYAADDMKAVYQRLDDLDLEDTQAFSAAFDENNSPTRSIVEDIVKASKAGNA